MARGAGNVVLHPAFHSNFHGGMECAIHGGFQDQQITNVHGREKINMVHGCGHHIAARMAVRGEGSGYVNQVHEASAEQIAQRICVIGQNHLCHLRLRISDRPWRVVLIAVCV